MSKLLNKIEKEYGDRYHDHILDQYKIYVDSAERISDRRQNANNYFLAINTILISLISLCVKIGIFDDYFIKGLVPLLGVILCVIFYYLIRSYRQLNAGKFEVIHKIEENLPLALYKYEWFILGEGHNENKYYPFSHIEIIIPGVFGIIYIVIGLISLI